MSKNKNRFDSIYSIEFVEDISHETAVNYSGGDGRINDGNNDPDLILYSELDAKGNSIKINAATGDGIPNLGDFNDLASSIVIKRGVWNFYTDSDYGYGPQDGGSSTIRLGPGNYNLGANNNKISSVDRRT